MQLNKYLKLTYTTLTIGLIAGSASFASVAGVEVQGDVTISTPDSGNGNSPPVIDFENAQPLPLPSIDIAPVAAPSRTPAYNKNPGSTKGGSGSGKMKRVKLAKKLRKVTNTVDTSGGGISSQEYGTYDHMFTTSRVDMYGRNFSKASPYRRAGKLFFNIGSSSYVCSASMIKPGVVVTAAHCVAGFGGSFYSGWTYVPGYKDGIGLFGTWTHSSAAVMSSYINGTETCAVSGVVCPNDVALIRLAPQGGDYAGNLTGWFGYGYDGYGFNSNDEALITQLGYPVSHDYGAKMQRTDSESYADSSYSDNNVIGSRQTGGSSGGPWLVNFGHRGVLNGTSPGLEAAANRVVGTTSWGYVSNSPKEMGASPFTSSNIVVLMDIFCPSGSTDPWCI